MSFSSTDALHIFSGCMLFVVVKLFTLASLAVVQRGRAKARINPEDVLRGDTAVEAEPPSVARVQRVHRNDVENVLPYFMVGTVALSLGVSPGPIVWCSLAFAAFRLVHSLGYLAKHSIFRAVGWVGGVLAALTLVAFSAAKLF